MRLRVLYGQKWLQARWLPEFLRCDACVLYPFVLFEKDRGHVPKTTIRHEIVHVRQTKEVGFWKFNLLYQFYFVRDLIRFRNLDKAYRENPYEKEAYQKQKWITLTSEEKKAVGWK